MNGKVLAPVLQGRPPGRRSGRRPAGEQAARLGVRYWRDGDAADLEAGSRRVRWRS
jgi:hypothetical protein